jgi:sarcosine reductase
MRLEFHMVKIKDIQFGSETRIDSGILYINREELQQRLMGDRRFRQVEIEVARPGEKCRIYQVADVIEPRAKIRHDNEGDLGNGIGPQIGEGKTCVLQGAAVAIIDCREQQEIAGSILPRGDIIDMSGPGSEMSPYGKTFNVVLLPKPKKGVNLLDYQAALKMAGLNASAYLANAGKDLEPNETEIYDLPPLTQMKVGLEGLPRITYIFQILSLQYEPIPGDPTLFGCQAGGIIPTILHPNQVLDGAITSALPGLNVQTYGIQNHPIIKELYRRHGQDLCFTGVIVTIAPNNVFEFDRMADIAASLAKEVIGADGAILTKIGGGAPELAMARTAQRCEQLGVKTAIAMLHMGADILDAKYGATTIFSIPEVDAIVSMGVPFMKLTLPPVERVIGTQDSLSEGPSLRGEIVQLLGAVKGSLCQLGNSCLTAVRD